MKNKVLSLIVALSFLLIGCADQLEIILHILHFEAVVGELRR